MFHLSFGISCFKRMVTRYVPRWKVQNEARYFRWVPSEPACLMSSDTDWAAVSPLLPNTHFCLKWYQVSCCSSNRSEWFCLMWYHLLRAQSSAEWDAASSSVQCDLLHVCFTQAMWFVLSVALRGNLLMTLFSIQHSDNSWNRQHHPVRGQLMDRGLLKLDFTAWKRVTQLTVWVTIYLVLCVGSKPPQRSGTACSVWLFSWCCTLYIQFWITV